MRFDQQDQVRIVFTSEFVKQLQLIFCHRFNDFPTGQKAIEENKKYEEMRSFPGVNTNACGDTEEGYHVICCG